MPSFGKNPHDMYFTMRLVELSTKRNLSRTEQKELSAILSYISSYTSPPGSPSRLYKNRNNNNKPQKQCPGAPRKKQRL